MYYLVRSLGKVAADEKQKLWDRFKQTSFAQWPDKSIWHRVYAVVTLVLFIVSTVAGVMQPFLNTKSYELSAQSRTLIPHPNTHLAGMLQYKAKDMAYAYNEGYSPSAAAASDLKKAGNGDPRFSATFATNPSKGITVTDPTNSVDFSLTPKFDVGNGKKDQNQMVYPLGKTDGFLVYTAQIASVKEDIVLQTADKDKMSFEYELGLKDGLTAKLEKDGSIGVYGSALPLYGNVATGSDKDAQLLQKAKDAAPKTKFLFGIPAPIVKETDKKQSTVGARFDLQGSKLTIVVENLKAASYPLTIDPSVYIESAAQLMNGNNESNVAFDVATEQFQKGSTTGARINAWTDTTDMNSSVYDQGTAAAGGYVYRAGGKTSKVMPRIAGQNVTTQSALTVNFVMNMPTTRPAGDLYVAFVATSGTTITAPAGWTLIKNTGTGSKIAAFYKIGANISGGNEASQYTFGTSAVSQQNAGVILRITNYDAASLATDPSTVGTASGIPTYPSVTPTQQGTLILSAAGFALAPPLSGYSPANYTDVSSANSGGVAGSLAAYTLSTLDSPPLSGAATGAQAISGVATTTYGGISFSIAGAAASTTTNSSVQWAHFNSSSGAIDSPAPGSNAAACSGWCTDSAYDLPTVSPSTSNSAGLVGMSMVAYNGYLYVMGGSDGTYLKSTVYIAKLGANGEPSLWHPTDPDQADWVYWYKDSGLSGGTAKAYFSATASNGRMYVLGGDTDAANNTTGATTAVQIANILPNGTLGSWSNGPVLSSARYGSTVQTYNGYLYILGGYTGSSMLNLVQYSHLNSDGTMNSWQTAAADGVSTFNTARSSQGGVMSGIWGGYIYLAGGCTTINASGYCTAIASDVQLASINSDGSLDVWNTMAGLRNQRFGSSFVAWQNNLYRFGGCSQQDASTGDCYATHVGVQYGTINQDGDASTVSVSTPYTTGNCTDPSPYDCNLPNGGTGSGQGGQMLVSTAILNGFIYVMGGCTTYQCNAMSGNTSYAAIDSNGRLKSPPTCAGGTNGAWCVDNTNQINTTNGVGAAASAVFGGYVYIIGGQDNGGLSDTVYRNQANADGSWVGAWAKQKMSPAALNFSLGLTSVSYTYAYARANPASAGTVPGNLYIFGGCTNTTCTTFTPNVYKCNILTDGSIDTDNGQLGSSGHNPCTTTGQQSIGTVTGASGAGLGIHAGAVYANYVYLVGGSAPGTSDLKTIRYAKFDNSNNIVAVSGSAWIESGNQTTIGRSRGAAFGYNGYLYVVGGYNTGVATTLKDIQFAKINVSDGSIGAFSTSIVTINQRWGLGLAVSNSYAYVIGGCNTGSVPNCASTGLDNTVQTFQVYNNDSGAPAQYSTSANLYTTDTNRIGAASAIYNGYLYVAGGCNTATDCTGATASVTYAPIDANGVVGVWNSGGALPTALAWGQLEVVGGTLYYLGGQTGADTTSVGTVYYTTGISSGNPTWSGTQATKGIGDTGSGAQARTQFSSVVWNNRIYVTGGATGGTPTVQSTIFASPDLSGGGNITANWTSSGMTSFNIARSGHTAIAYANNLYIIGGFDGTNYLSDVQFAQISSTGEVGSWKYSTNLPSPIRQADGFASNGYMYIFGGRSSLNDCSARTLIAPISANTTIASGNNPTGVGEWYQTNRNFDGGRYGAAVSLYQGKAYMVGGGCQGIVMQDDFDPNYDASQWSSTSGFAANTNCQSTSISNTFSTNTGTNYAATKSVDVSGGGTVLFKLYIPLADTGTCFKGEGPLLDFNPDNVTLRYCTATCGSPPTNWTTIGGNYNFGQQDPMKPYVVTIPAGAQTTATRFGWFMQGGEANDSFALEDVSIIATGSNGIAYASASRVTQTALLSQPQIANYSRQVDAGNDVFPTKWLMNGLDNSIGARWQFRYRSMNDPTNTTQPCGGTVMTAYGQETNYGDVTLGTPAIYTVKDSSGTNIGCGRYFFMDISIDASQTYGYPDDITRGPTLDNLTLFFNSNPGKRLIHGKTFIEGIQQPLNTQP